MRGNSAAFDADPTGNNDYAGRIADRLYRKAERAMVSATIPTSTVLGLNAKARMLRVALEDNSDQIPHDLLGFLYGVASDLLAFTDNLRTQEPAEGGAK